VRLISLSCAVEPWPLLLISVFMSVSPSWCWSSVCPQSSAFYVCGHGSIYSP
jgi:hypothetical protein